MAAKRFASLAVDEIEKKKMLINAKETMKSNQTHTLASENSVSFMISILRLYGTP
jgi:hypothetical protein